MLDSACDAVSYPMQGSIISSENCQGLCDEDNGSPTKPLKRLYDVHNLITDLKVNLPAQDPIRYPSLPDDNIDVIIKPGTYYGTLGPEESRGATDSDAIYIWAENWWLYHMANNTITFHAADPTDPPVFDGCDPNEDCCYSDPKDFSSGDNNHSECLSFPNETRCHCTHYPNDNDPTRSRIIRRRAGAWFFLDTSGATEGDYSNIIFSNIIVRNYQDGITFKGSWFNTETTWNGRNTVRGCSFENIGNSYIADFDQYCNESQCSLGKGCGFTAVGFKNSRENIVLGNTFNKLQSFRLSKFPDVEQCPIMIHGTYGMTDSHHNIIAGNEFKHITGQAVKITNFSNRDQVVGNLFSDIHKAAFQQAFCNFTETIGCPNPTKPKDNGWAPAECPPFETVFNNNILDGTDGWGGCNGSLTVVDLQDLPGPGYLYNYCCTQDNNPDDFSCGDSVVRISASGNIITNQPCACQDFSPEQCRQSYCNGGNCQEIPQFLR